MNEKKTLFLEEYEKSYGVLFAALENSGVEFDEFLEWCKDTDFIKGLDSASKKREDLLLFKLLEGASAGNTEAINTLLELNQQAKEEQLRKDLFGVWHNLNA